MTGPERIWVKPCFPCSEPDDYYLCHPQHLTPGATSYVRADLHDEVVKALREAEETLRMVEHPAFPDPQHHREVKAIGARIGFGALISTASAGWREALKEGGYPVGGEFVAGPCHATVVSCLANIRAALARTGEG